MVRNLKIIDKSGEEIFIHFTEDMEKGVIIENYDKSKITLQKDINDITIILKTGVKKNDHNESN